MSGAWVSIVTIRSPDTATLVALRVDGAGADRVNAVGERASSWTCQLPLVIGPTSLATPSTNSRTCVPAVAVPRKTGLGTLVMLSELDGPRSLAGWRSGVEGATGPVPPVTKVRPQPVPTPPMLPMVSSTTKIRQVPAGSSAASALERRVAGASKGARREEVVLVVVGRAVQARVDTRQLGQVACGGVGEGQVDRVLAGDAERAARVGHEDDALAGWVGEQDVHVLGPLVIHAIERDAQLADRAGD